MYRITNSMLASNYLTNMRRNLRNMQTIQSQLASGKEISRPSDDPYKASRTMQLYTEIDANKQFNENIKDVSNWLDTTDTALDQAGKVFLRVKELLVSAGNSSYGPNEQKAVQDEIKQKVHELSQILNTNFDGAYIFGGTKSTSKPVTVDSSGMIQYANKKGDAINDVYINAAGNVVNVPISNNIKLNQTDAIYLDPNGKITKSATTIADNGTSITNTKIVPTDSLFIDTGTGLISTSTGSGSPLLLKDNLYVDAKGNITSSKISDNTLITSDDELLYSTPTGEVTTIYNVAYTQIPTGTDLYRDSAGKVTISSTSPNTKINQSTPLYVDVEGKVTTSSTTANTKITGSVTGLNISKYLPSGYSSTPIDPSCNVYKDSRGFLTNSGTTDLSSRKCSLEDLWKNSYINSGNEQLTVGSPTSKQDKQLHLYKDSTGLVTTSPGGYPANEEIQLGTNLYKNADGKITTVPGATPVQLTDTVYVDLNGAVIIPSTPTAVPNTAVSVRDELYISGTDNKAYGWKTGDPAPVAGSVTIPSDKVNVYVDGSGNITNIGTGVGKTPIKLSNSLYLDSYGNITISKDTQNILVNSDDKLYTDPNGNVVKSQTNTQIPTGTTLYKDSSGRVTAIKGSAPPNEAIDLSTTALYKDAKGNVTTQASISGIANTLIDSSKTNLYQDVNGNITTVDKNTLITSDMQLYKLKDISGNVVGVTTIPTPPTPTGITANTTQLYVDPVTKNVTHTPIGSPIPTNALAAGADLYVDKSGQVTIQASTAGEPNTKIPRSTTTLYIDPSNQVKTDIIKTGDSLYIDTNGKIIMDKTTTNTELTTKDTVYADAAGYLTMSSTAVNKELDMAGVRSLKSELQNSSITTKRKNEINNILADGEAIQLAQLDSDLNVEVSQGVFINYNITSSDVLEYKDKNGQNKKLPDILNDIITNLGTGGDISKVTGEDLTQVDAIIQNILQKRSEVGAMTNRMESAQSKNEDENLSMSDILSKTEDIDFTETMMQYSTMQTIYMAALQTSGKILPATLLDYIR